MVMLSGPSSDTAFTMLSNAVYSVQFLFCALQLSTQNITFGSAVSLSTYECRNCTNYISKYFARLLFFLKDNVKFYRWAFYSQRSNPLIINWLFNGTPTQNYPVITTVDPKMALFSMAVTDLCNIIHTCILYSIALKFGDLTQNP